MFFCSKHMYHLLSLYQESRNLPFYYEYAQVSSYLYQILLRFYQTHYLDSEKLWKCASSPVQYPDYLFLSKLEFLVNLTAPKNELPNANSLRAVKSANLSRIQCKYSSIVSE